MPRVRLSRSFRRGPVGKLKYLGNGVFDIKGKKRTYKKIGMVTNRKEQIRDLLQSYLRGLLQIRVATPPRNRERFLRGCWWDRNHSHVPDHQVPAHRVFLLMSQKAKVAVQTSNTFCKYYFVSLSFAPVVPCRYFHIRFSQSIMCRM